MLCDLEKINRIVMIQFISTSIWSSTSLFIHQSAVALTAFFNREQYQHIETCAKRYDLFPETLRFLHHLLRGRLEHVSRHDSRTQLLPERAIGWVGGVDGAVLGM